MTSALDASVFVKACVFMCVCFSVCFCARALWVCGEQIFAYFFLVRGRLSSHYREVMKRVLTTLV